MAQEQKSQIIIFPENINETIAGLFEKYGIKETRQDAIKRFRVGKYPKAVFLAKKCREYFENKIADNDFANSLREEFGISDDAAKKMFLDAKEKIIRKISVEVETKEEAKKEATENKTDHKQILSQNTKATTPPKKLLNTLPTENSTMPEKTKKLTKKPAISPKPKNNKIDKYRESIE